MTNLHRPLGLLLLVVTPACASFAPDDETSSMASAISANLVRNPGCETDTAHWGSWRGTLRRTTSVAHGGVAACEVTQASGASFTIDDTPDTVVNPPVGARYTATAWVRGPTRRPARLYLRQQGGAAATAIRATEPVVLTDTWQRLSLAVTIDTAGRSALDLYVGLSDAVAGDRFYVDDISLVRDDDATPSTPTQPTGTTPTPQPPPAPTTAPLPQIGDCTRYASPSGNDASTGTDRGAPVRTLARANALARPGDVWCFADGVYPAGNVTLSANGTSSLPITYRSASGQGAILDASGMSISSSSAVVNVTGSHVTVAAFEVRNSSGRGLMVSGATDVTIRGNKVHDIQYAAILVSGHSLKIDGNEVYEAAASNRNGHFGGASCSGGGWPAVVQTWYIWPNTNDRTTDVVFSNNDIHDSWGEGLGLFHVNRGVVKGNTVRDTWSVLTYLDGSANVEIDGNYLASANPTYFRCDKGSPANAILLSGEESYDQQLANVTIKNNLVAGASQAVSYWNAGQGIGYSNLKILNNTFYGARSPAIRLDASPGAPGGVVQNNIVFGSGALSLGNGSFTVTNNDFPNGIPSGAPSASNFAFDPQLVAPAVGAPASGFKVSTSSKARANGAARAEVTRDFFGAPRSATPTIGFHEQP